MDGINRGGLQMKMKREALPTIVGYFDELPANKIDQWEALWDQGNPCCVFAHLAHILGAGDYYRDGAAAFCRVLGANMAHVLLMLRQCGAPRNCFGTDKWPVALSQVFRRLAQIESLPDTRGADLADADLTDAYLVDANLAGANLAGAYLDGRQPCGRQP